MTNRAVGILDALRMAVCWKCICVYLYFCTFVSVLLYLYLCKLHTVHSVLSLLLSLSFARLNSSTVCTVYTGVQVNYIVGACVHCTGVHWGACVQCRVQSAHCAEECRRAQCTGVLDCTVSHPLTQFPPPSPAAAAAHCPSPAAHCVQQLPAAPLHTVLLKSCSFIISSWSMIWNYIGSVCMSDQVLQSRVHYESVTIPNHRRGHFELSFYFPHPLTDVVLRNWSNSQTNQFESYNVHWRRGS